MDVFTQLVSYFQVVLYTIDSLTKLFSWILWELRELVHHVHNLWLITIHKLAKLTYNFVIVELLVKIFRNLKSSQYVSGEGWRIPWSYVGMWQDQVG